MDNYGKLWKIWKETAFIKLCPFFIDLLAFELGKLRPGMGIFASFFNPGSGVLHWKAVPVVGILTEKLVAREVGGGGNGNQSNWYLHYQN